jgi:hypothetical protein
MQKLNMLGTNKASFKYATVIAMEGTLNVFPRENRKGCYTNDIVLEKVEIQIMENGNMHVTGDRIMYDYLGHLYTVDGYDYSDYEELKKEDAYFLDEKYARRRKFLWWEYGNVIYDGGYTERKEREPYEVMTSNYRITGV